MSFILRLRSKPTVLTDLRNISPDKFAGRMLNEIRSLSAVEGGRAVSLDTFFDIDGPSRAPQEVGSIEITVEGGTDKLCYIGYKMTGGKIVIKGSTGHFTGYKMKGGTIVIYGDTRNYLGAKMAGGTIEVFGNVGHRIGSKLHGEKPGKGMKGGTIMVHGNAGADVGWGASGGTIIIDGSAGNFVGSEMTGGVVVVKGSAGIYPGAGMAGGRIVIGGAVKSLLPSFYLDSIAPSIKVKKIPFDKPFAIFIGDVTVLGRGFLQVSYEDNKDLLEPLTYVLSGE